MLITRLTAQANAAATGCKRDGPNTQRVAGPSGIRPTQFAAGIADSVVNR